MGQILTQRVLSKLDEHLGRNDYDAAERHLLYWFAEAKAENDKRCMMLILNELAGLYRKLGREEDALRTVSSALELIEEMGIAENIGAGTTYINCATVYKAFGKAESALPLFEKAKSVYEKELSPDDKRFGGLFNNMALALVDLERYDEAYELYDKAVTVMENADDGDLEVAITYLNIASAKETELGAVESDEVVREYIEKAMKILDEHENRDGYYAFVCEKCASVFGYFGYFIYEKDLEKRARDIYERS
ncbi:MAG: tetratricopeptide repeat protein [Acutalibacteraceae bacterium]|nr:tetratricopeptide repeat protein [Acutalibacteraceae bacterium]